MISIHKEIRKRLKVPLGNEPTGLTLESLRATEWSTEFENLMRNRLLMGALRYGRFADKHENMYFYDLVKESIHRLQLYQKTGNDELLVDIANFMLLEFRFGKHPKKHFKPGDDSIHAKHS